MKVRSGIIAESAFLLAARIANPAATVALGIYVARRLGVETFGEFSFVLTYYFLFSVAFSLGLSTLVSRETAKSPEQTALYFWNGSVIAVLSGVAGLVLMVALAGVFSLSAEAARGLRILSLSMIPATLIQLWESLLTTFGRNRYITAVQFAEALLKASTGFLVLFYGYGMVALLALFLLARLLACAAYYGILKHVFHPLQADISRAFIRSILGDVPTFAALYLLSVLFSKVDLMILALMKDFTDVGIYSAAYKLLEVSFLAPTCAVAVLFPALARAAKESTARFVEISTRSLFWSLAITVPIVVAVATRFADRIIVFVYSEAFARSALPLRILIITLALYMLDQVFAHSLVARNLEKLNLRSLVAATLVNIALNIVLIPRYSVVGASVATLVSMAVLTATHHHFVRKHLYRLNLARTSMAVAAIALPTGLIVAANGVAMWALLAAFLVLYGPLLVYLQGLLPRGGNVPSSAVVP